jgi:TRAP-type C4-dicarboxylate transport system substrate-binding protein
MRGALKLGLCLIGLLLAGFPASSLAQVPWQMASEYPETSVSGIGLATFGRLVAEHTSGAVMTVNAFDNALKVSSGEMPNAVRQSRITGGDAFAGPLEAVDPVFGLPSLPFVAQSVEAASAIDSRARGLYEKALRAQGLKLLYITLWPPTGLWSDRPINTADDLRTLAVRTYDDNSAEVLRAVGASAESLPFSEAISRLRDHKLNAILSSGDGGAGRQLWNYLKYFTAINYAIPISIAFVRMETFQALPSDVQNQVEAAAEETERLQLANLSNRVSENYQRMRANGVVIAEPAAADVLAALNAAAQKPIESWKARAGGEAAAIAEQAVKQR